MVDKLRKWFTKPRDPVEEALTRVATAHAIACSILPPSEASKFERAVALRLQQVAREMFSGLEHPEVFEHQANEFEGFEDMRKRLIVTKS